MVHRAKIKYLIPTSHLKVFESDWILAVTKDKKSLEQKMIPGTSQFIGVGDQIMPNIRPIYATLAKKNELSNF